MTWCLVEQATDLSPDNGMMRVNIEDTNIALIRIGDDYFALANICTHQYALLTEGFVEDGCIECPLHQGLFDIRTGKALGAPVTKDLQTFATKFEGGKVFVSLSETVIQPLNVLSNTKLSKVPSSIEKIVVVGGGQAAAVAVRTMRKKGYLGSITLVSNEYHLPYERPPLSKGILLNQTLWHETQSLTPNDIEELQIKLMLGKSVTALDLAKKQVMLTDDQSLTYDRLLLVTGARPRYLSIEGAELPLVHYLRTLDEAIALKLLLKKGCHVAIIGGGFIGLEVASSAIGLGCTVELIEASTRLCNRALHPRAAMQLHQFAENAGVKVITNALVERIVMEGAQAQLNLASGKQIKADVVVVGIGAIANSEIAEAAGLKVNNGIWVNELGQTSDPFVYSAGDVAIWPHSKKHPLRLESWFNAQEQAISSASSMINDPVTYDVIPWFWTDQFGHNIQMLGLPNGNDSYEWVSNSDDSGGVYYFHNEKHLTGVVSFDNPAAIKKARHWLTIPIEIQMLRESIGSLKTQTDVFASTHDKRSSVMSNLAQYFVWPEEGLRRIPDWVYTDPVIYQMEVEKIFHGPNWNYVGLEAEIPQSGDFIRSFVGPTAVILSRDEEDNVNVFLNRCSHRAAEFCRELRGNNKEFVCPYHQWTYDLEGNLSGIPFRRGVAGKGGLPKDFDSSAHSLTKLKVTMRNGVIFASFSDDVPSLEDYLGPRLLEEFDATFDGRKLKVIGYYRNTVPGNWKLYHENLKDPYHATLLHTFLVSFGLLVAGNKAEMICDETGRHGVMASAKSETGKVSAEDMKEMRAYKPDFQLQEPSMLDFNEEFDSPWSVTMMTLWPNLIVQREMNTLGVRQIVPQGPNEFIMNWTMFGFEGDSEETLKHRMRQGNLMGPAGFLGLEDNEAMKFVQDGMKRSLSGQHLIEMDPNTEVGTADTLISESAIRAMYQNWRKELGII